MKEQGKKIRLAAFGILNAGLAISLIGCQSETILEGERQDITSSNLVITDEFKDTGSVRIGAASNFREWRQGAGNSSNNPGNVTIGGYDKLWTNEITYEAGRGWFGGGYTRSSARPIVYDGKVYTYQQNAEINSYDLDSGNSVWKVSLKPETEDGSGAGGGIVADKGQIFAATGYGELVALDARTGEIKWKLEMETPARNAPAALGGKVYVVLQSNEVVAVDQSAGTQLWTFAGVPEIAGLLADSNPAVKGNSVVVPFTSGEVMSIDSTSGEANWVDAVSKPFKTLAVSGISDVSASPVISNDSVIATSVAGQTISLNLETGERNWERNIGSAHTPAVSGNAIFVIDLDDRLIALNRETGKTFWVTQLPVDKTSSERATWAGPLVGNSQILAVSSEGNLATVSPDGEILSEKEFSNKTFVSPVTAGGYLVVLESDGISVFQ